MSFGSIFRAVNQHFLPLVKQAASMIRGFHPRALPADGSIIRY